MDQHRGEDLGHRLRDLPSTGLLPDWSSWWLGVAWQSEGVSLNILLSTRLEREWNYTERHGETELR